MSITFNADEVFKMAERAEDNAARFYRRAAELHAGSGADIAFLEDMAGMEDAHRELFASMRVELSESMSEPTAADPYVEAHMYLQEMADTHVGEGNPAATEALSGDESLEQVIRTGIDGEQKAVTFYLGIRDMVPEKLGRDKIDAVISEERHHIAVLARELMKIRQSA